MGVGRWERNARSTHRADSCLYLAHRPPCLQSNKYLYFRMYFFMKEKKTHVEEESCLQQVSVCHQNISNIQQPFEHSYKHWLYPKNSDCALCPGHPTLQNGHLPASFRTKVQLATYICFNSLLSSLKTTEFNCWVQNTESLWFSVVNYRIWSKKLNMPVPIVMFLNLSGIIWTHVTQYVLHSRYKIFDIP